MYIRLGGIIVVLTSIKSNPSSSRALFQFTALAPLERIMPIDKREIAFLKDATFDELVEYCKNRCLKRGRRSIEALREWLLAHVFHKWDFARKLFKREWTSGKDSTVSFCLLHAAETHAVRFVGKTRIYFYKSVEKFMRGSDEEFPLTRKMSSLSVDTESPSPPPKKHKSTHHRDLSGHDGESKSKDVVVTMDLDVVVPKTTQTPRLPSCRTVCDSVHEFEKANFSVAFVRASWNDNQTVFALTRKDTGEFLEFAFCQLLFCRREDSPDEPVYADTTQTLCVRDPKHKGQFYNNLPVCDTWVKPDPDEKYDYDQHRTGNHAYIQTNRSDLVKRYGAGTWVVVAKSQLIAACDTPKQARAISARVPVRSRFIDCVGVKIFALHPAPILCTSWSGVGNHPTVVTCVHQLNEDGKTWDKRTTSHHIVDTGKRSPPVLPSITPFFR